MRPMSSLNFSQRVAADRQPDLFDERASFEPDRVPAPTDRDARITVWRLTDGELIAMLPEPRDYCYD